MRAQTADAATTDTFALPRAAALTATPARGDAWAPNPVPAWPDVVREQLAAVGLGLRREGLIAAGCALLGTVVILATQAAQGEVNFPFSPKMGIAPALMALLLPMAVWKNEEPAARGYHYAMPVSRTAHATARTAAGLAWLMAALVAFFAWVGLLSLATHGPVDHAAPWEWMAPFVGIAVVYLLGSALTLVSAHPWRWLGGGLVGFFFLQAFKGVAGLGWITGAANTAFSGRFGLSTLLLGAVLGWEFAIRTNFGAWLVSVCIWGPVSVGAFAVAAHRQPDS